VKLVIFGLTVTSSWGNGHATIWRGLLSALATLGHDVTFFERDVPYYASHRDLRQCSAYRIELYQDWTEALALARKEIAAADAAIVTSYCPDAVDVTELLISSSVPVRVFYDLDTPVTLDRLRDGGSVEYIPRGGLSAYDLVLSYTGGRALGALKTTLGARAVAPLYGSADPAIHKRVAPIPDFRADLSYLGTYASDRQHVLQQLFLEPALALPDKRFVIGGAQYPQDFPWAPNIWFMQHVAPPQHPHFYSSSALTLNITRAAMAEMGYCPSGRLFEAAACGTPIVSDWWEGLDEFFEPGREILIASTPDEVMGAMTLPADELRRIGAAARARTLNEHTAMHRARDLVQRLGMARCPTAVKSTCAAPVHCKKEVRMWGIVPAAGIGSRIQPLAFSKELLPVGRRRDGNTERPRAVSEYLLDRMVEAGVTKICFVIAPGKSDIMNYYGGRYRGATVCYTVQARPNGLCDAVFTALAVVDPGEDVLIGLPDTVWFPEDGYTRLPQGLFSFLLFPVAHPEYFDAVVTDDEGRVQEIQVKQQDASSSWIWGAFRLPGSVLLDLHRLWKQRNECDPYIGTLVNAYLAAGGNAYAVRAGTQYIDVGTLQGYRAAVTVLAGDAEQHATTAPAE
jgi:spore maturation protein CgeB/dTDP-glucose pyrophosphorylase